MRQRGANITDIVILVVAADDGVKDQTRDSIACARQAGVPIIVAINKIDKPEADVERVQNELFSFELVSENLGGDTLMAPVSALEKTGLDGLLDKVLLQAEILELKANPERDATGVVVEASVQKGLGTVATTLVQRGTLRIGDIFVAGEAWGKVRALLNDKGERIEEAGPSTPVQVVGWGKEMIPMAGDALAVCESEQLARKIAESRAYLGMKRLDAGNEDIRSASIAELFGKRGDKDAAAALASALKEKRTLPVVVKADVQGSLEALTTALEGMVAEDDVAQVKVKVLAGGVGEVTRNDVAVASVANAKVIAFSVGANFQATEDARVALGGKPVEIGYYGVIYEVLEELEAKMADVLSPTPDGELVGSAEVQTIFEIGKLGKVAGCMIKDGYMKKGANVRVMKGDAIMYDGKLKTLRHFKEDVAQLDAGNECGMSFIDWEEMQDGMVVECYVE